MRVIGGGAAHAETGEQAGATQGPFPGRAGRGGAAGSGSLVSRRQPVSRSRCEEEGQLGCREGGAAGAGSRQRRVYWAAADPEEEDRSALGGGLWFGFLESRGLNGRRVWPGRRRSVGTAGGPEAEQVRTAGKGGPGQGPAPRGGLGFGLRVRGAGHPRS